MIPMDRFHPQSDHVYSRRRVILLVISASCIAALLATSICFHASSSSLVPGTKPSVYHPAILRPTPLNEHAQPTNRVSEGSIRNGVEGVYQWNICPLTEADFDAMDQRDSDKAAEMNLATTNSQLETWPRDKSEPLTSMGERITDGSNVGCMSFVPTAWNVGITQQPRLAFTLTHEQLKQGGQADETFERFPTPWHMMLVIDEVRYSHDRGGFFMLALINDIVVQMRTSEGIVQQNTIDLYNNRVNKILDQLFPVNVWSPEKVPLLCAYSTSTNGVVDMPVVAAERVISSTPITTHLELFCPFPAAPKGPPPRLNIRLAWSKGFLEQYQYKPEEDAVEPVLDNHTLVPVCRNWKPLRSMVYCGRLVNPAYYSSLVEFIRHHAYLGYEHFDLEDVYGIHRKILQDWSGEGGMVSYTRRGEHAYFYTDGKKSHMPLWYLQMPNQGSCIYRHHESARWIAFHDLDEYFFFPDTERFVPKSSADALTPHRPQYAPTCMKRTEQGALVMDLSAGPSDKDSNGACKHSWATNSDRATFPHAFTSIPLFSNTSADSSSITPTLYSQASGLTCGCRSMIADYMASLWFAHVERGASTSPESGAVMDLVSLNHVRFTTWNHNLMDEAAKTQRAEFLKTHSPYDDSNTEAVCFMNFFAGDIPLLMQFPYPDALPDHPLNSKYFFHPQSSCNTFIHNAYSCWHAHQVTEGTNWRQPQPVTHAYFMHMQNSAHNRRPSNGQAVEEVKQGKATFLEWMEKDIAALPVSK